ncbi:MAG: LapA family protein [Gammaproteobacteria bacterium]|nr:LapA family protein [Gammaproteobacteria bacterium]MBU1979418.1 LapA family protein [Gammaproteobacteria bacterium]
MRYLSWLFGFALFLLALGFAVKNSDTVVVNYYLGYQWQAPMVLVLLAFLIAGVAIGVAASLGFIFRQRREIFFLKREMRARAKAVKSDE